MYILEGLIDFLQCGSERKKIKPSDKLVTFVLKIHFCGGFDLKKNVMRRGGRWGGV